MGVYIGIKWRFIMEAEFDNWVDKLYPEEIAHMLREHLGEEEINNILWECFIIDNEHREDMENERED